MSFDLRSPGGRGADHDGARPGAPTPGKHTRVGQIVTPAGASARPGAAPHPPDIGPQEVASSSAGRRGEPSRISLHDLFGRCDRGPDGAATTEFEAACNVQRIETAASAVGADHVHAAAMRGTATSATTLPFADQIQRAFGRHDVSGIQAHVGGEAAASARAMNARAYATGEHVVLGEGADLRTVAHEAAHVIQQRGGVQLESGLGEAGDRHEQQADKIADRVVQNESAEGLFDPKPCVVPGATAGSAMIQRSGPDEYIPDLFTDSDSDVDDAGTGSDWTMEFYDLVDIPGGLEGITGESDLAATAFPGCYLAAASGNDQALMDVDPTLSTGFPGGQDGAEGGGEQAGGGEKELDAQRVEPSPDPATQGGRLPKFDIIHQRIIEGCVERGKNNGEIVRELINNNYKCPSGGIGRLKEKVQRHILYKGLRPQPNVLAPPLPPPVAVNAGGNRGRRRPRGQPRGAQPAPGRGAPVRAPGAAPFDGGVNPRKPSHKQILTLPQHKDRIQALIRGGPPPSAGDLANKILQEEEYSDIRAMLERHHPHVNRGTLINTINRLRKLPEYS